MAYTTIDDPSAYFQTTLWTGNGSARAITNSGNSDLQPDWIWGKNRSDSNAHWLMDSTRGVDKRLISSGNDAEDDPGTAIHTAFGSNGFSLGTNSEGNKNGDSYVAWQWKANGGTTTTNDASSTGVGTIDSVYQANTTAGFSIVTYTGTGSNGTIAHGLGSAPNWVLVKSRGNADPWHNLVDDIGANETLEFNSYSMGTGVWNTTRPTSTVFSIGTNNGVNRSSGTFVAYCFAEKQGYSKFGKYTGNNNTNGTFIYTGFKPSWVMVKRTDANGNNWPIWDNKRGVNGNRQELYANLNNADATDSAIDILSNGFKLRNSSTEWNNGDYIYMAFAEHPFVSSEGVPTTAR